MHLNHTAKQIDHGDSLPEVFVVKYVGSGADDRIPHLIPAVATWGKHRAAKEDSRILLATLVHYLINAAFRDFLVGRKRAPRILLAATASDNGDQTHFLLNM